MAAFQFRKQSMVLLVRGLFLLAGLVLAGAQDKSSSAAEKKEKKDLKEAYQLYNKKCLSCHLSVADPEKSGRTRDEWYLVVNTMHRYGLDVSPAESEAIVDLLFRLRKGIEKEPG